MIGDMGMCSGKKSYDTYWQAQRSARRLNRKQDGAKGNPYKCPGTRHFHVGNSLGRIKKKQLNRHTRKERALHGRIEVSE